MDTTLHPAEPLSLPGTGRARSGARIQWGGPAALIALIVLCNLVGGLGALVTDTDGWYQALDKPYWQPPSWLFAPVWTALYTTMALALWLVLRRRDQRPAYTRRAVAWFGAQLALNAAWSPLFFGLHAVMPALVVILLLVAAIATTMVRFALVSRPAAALLAPYLVWVGFASTLNAAILALNGGS